MIWVSGQFEHYAYAYHLVRSDWTPPICPPYIEIPLLAIRHELCAISPQQIKHKPNLSTHEFATLRKLFANKNIFILPSDKNLGPTIVTSRWYEEELSRLLSDKKFYDAVEEVPYATICNKLSVIIQRYGRPLGDRMAKFLLSQTSNVSPAKFKILPIKCIKIRWWVDLLWHPLRTSLPQLRGL